MSDDTIADHALDNEPFLNRWSRRKLEAETVTESEPESGISPPESAPSLTDDDMPPLESLDEHSDYAGFLSTGVSEGLRQAALQKLFNSRCFNVCDGLDDYAEDFTRFEKLGDLITADLRHRLQREAERLAQRVETSGKATTEPAEGGDGTEQLAQSGATKASTPPQPISEPSHPADTQDPSLS
ncbi:MAG: DUF3306 domain-containing protein [Candidatus Thiodiazotropha sp.]